MIYCLKQFPGFSKFLKFNNINDESLLNACKYFDHTEIGKGQFLYREADKPELFYGVVSGQIIEEKSSSIFQYIIKNPHLFLNIKDRKSKKFSVRSDRESLNVETESVSYKQSKLDNQPIATYFKVGDCFGENDLLHMKKKSANAYALEHTHLFTLDSTSFNYCFGKDMIKSEFERNDFISKNVLCGLDSNTLGFLLSILKPVLLDYGDYIYREGSSKTDTIYILYHGTAVLEKKVIKGKLESLKEAIHEDINYPSCKILHVSSGNVSGLEIITKAKLRKFSMKATSPFVSALSFNFSQISSDSSEKVIAKLKPYLNILEEAHKNLSKNYFEELQGHIINYNNHFDLKDTLFDPKEKVNQVTQIIEQLTNLADTSHPGGNLLSTNGNYSKELLNSSKSTHIMIKPNINMQINPNDVNNQELMSKDARLIAGTNIKYHYLTSKRLSQLLKKTSVEQGNSKALTKHKKKFSSKISKLLKLPAFIDTFEIEHLATKSQTKSTSISDNATSAQLNKASSERNYTNSLFNKSMKLNARDIKLDRNLSTQTFEVLSSTASCNNLRASKLKFPDTLKSTELMTIRDGIVDTDSEISKPNSIIKNKSKLIKGSIDSEDINPIRLIKKTIKIAASPNFMHINSKELLVSIPTEDSLTRRIQHNNMPTPVSSQSFVNQISQKSIQTKERVNLGLKSELLKNVKAWNSTKHSLFHTGSFRMPLCSELEK